MANKKGNKAIGRPKGSYEKYSPKFRIQLLNKFLNYIKRTQIPIIQEFCYKHNIPKSSIYEFDEFSEPLKMCIAKKEANLEKLGLKNKLNPTVTIFSLKQLGWKDTNTITINKTNYSDDDIDKMLEDEESDKI